MNVPSPAPWHLNVASVGKQSVWGLRIIARSQLSLWHYSANSSIPQSGWHRAVWPLVSNRSPNFALHYMLTTSGLSTSRAKHILNISRTLLMSSKPISSKVMAALNAKMCRPDSRSLLCKLPWYLTATSGQNASLDEMFPKTPKTSRDLENFLTLKGTMSMTDVARRCGEPDEVGGSGIAIFIYHLNDGSLVAIGATGAPGRILYANHIETSGKTSALIPVE